jgi:hypothetical protein
MSKASSGHHSGRKQRKSKNNTSSKMSITYKITTKYNYQATDVSPFIATLCLYLPREDNYLAEEARSKEKIFGEVLFSNWGDTFCERENPSDPSYKYKSTKLTAASLVELKEKVQCLKESIKQVLISVVKENQQVFASLPGQSSEEITIL